MSLTHKIAQHTILQFSSKIIGTILGLVSVGLITRYLGTQGYGYYTTVMGFLQFFGILADLGLTITTGQMLGHSKWSEARLFSNILSFRVITAFGFLALAPIAMFAFPYSSEIRVGISITTLSFFFISLSQIFLGFYQKHLNLFWVSVSEIVNRVVLLIGIILAIFWDFRLLGILIAVILSNTVQVAILFLPARKIARFGWEINGEIWRAIWQQSWPIAISIALNLIYLKTDIIILSIYRSPSEVGLYGAPYKIIEVLVTLPFILCGMLLPLLTRFWHDGDYIRFKELVQKGFDALAIFAWPMMIGSWFISDDLMALIGGEEFRSAGSLLNLLIIGGAMIFFSAIFSHAIVAIKQQKATIWIYALAAIIGLIGYFVFIPTYGAQAAAIFTIITESIVAILIFASYVRFTKLWPSMRRFVPILLSCAAMAIVLNLISDTSVVLRLIIAPMVYLAALLLFGGVNRLFLRDLVSFRQ